jgi:hypothetical protein
MDKIDVWMSTLEELKLILPRCPRVLDQFYHSAHGFQRKLNTYLPSIISHAVCLEASFSLPRDSSLHYSASCAQIASANLFTSTPWSTGANISPTFYPVSVAIPAVCKISEQVIDQKLLTQKMTEGIEVIVAWIAQFERRPLATAESNPMLHGMFLFRVRRALAMISDSSTQWPERLAKFKNDIADGNQTLEYLAPSISILDKLLQERLYYYISMCSAIPNNEEDAFQLGYLVYSLDNYAGFRNDVLIEHAIELALNILFKDNTLPKLQLIYRDEQQNISGTPLEILTLLSRMSLVRRNFHRYWKAFNLAYQWVTTTRREGVFRNPSIYCWMAEPWRGVGEPEAWINVAVIEFLAAYQELLLDVCANELLSYFGATIVNSAISWNQVINYDGIRDVISEEFITPVLDDLKNGSRLRKASIILFGPPGTSKTSYARAIATELGMPLVELKPHDFAIDGTEGVIKRSREVFRRLSVMKSCVVFFDEIDELVSKRDAEQQKIGRFITTSVLPWLQDLRELGRLVFIVATNHVENFDPAIRRLGRFDYVLPVGPPDAIDRKLLLERFIKESDRSRTTNISQIIQELEDAISAVRLPIRFWQKGVDIHYRLGMSRSHRRNCRAEVAIDNDQLPWTPTIGELKHMIDCVLKETALVEPIRWNEIIKNLVQRVSANPLITADDSVRFELQKKEYRSPPQ